MLLWLVGGFFSIYIFLTYIFFGVPLSALWIDKIYEKKEALAGNITTNKIVFCGGSATLFGVRTKDIQNELRVPVLNLASHAGLDTDYILDRVKRSLRAGDIVILPLEYELYSYDGRPNIVKLEYIFTYDRGYLWTLPISEVLRNILSINSEALIKSLHEKSLPIIKEPEINNGYTYVSASLDENGDETSNIGNKPFDAAPLHMPLGEKKERRGLRIVKEFNEWCKRNGISLLVTFPNTVGHGEYKKEYYRGYFARLKNYFTENDIQAIGKAEDFFFDKSLFYDTYYHLNQDGVTLRTKDLIYKMKELAPINTLIHKISEQYELKSAFHSEPTVLIQTLRGEGGLKPSFGLNENLVTNSKPSDLKVSGMRTAEGPYEQWKLPRVRWINSPSAKIEFENVSNAREIRLVMSFRPQVRSTSHMKVLFNKRVVKTYELREREAWHDDTLSLSPKEGVNVIEFLNELMPNESIPPDSLYMLFRTLTLSE
jgi:hypothetical protein